MKVFVVGAGVMGSGIGQVFAMAGNRVTLYDVREDALRKAREGIAWSLNKLREKGVVKDPEETLGRISFSNSLECGGSDLVIEAVFEDLKVKGEVLREVSAKTKGVIATNTSSLPITELSTFVKRPERFLGMHFFNPPVLMKLVEVIRGEKTSDETFQFGLRVVSSLGKYPLPVRKDVFGFVVNRVLFRLFTAGCSLLALYTPEQIDYVATNRLGMPMGLIMLLDYTGLDVNYNIAKEASRRGFEFQCPPLEERVKQGKLGAKSGEGFYNWSRGRPDIRAEGGPDPSILLEPAVKEALWLVREGVVEEEELERGVELGLGMKKGIFKLARELGVLS